MQLTIVEKLPQARHPFLDASIKRMLIDRQMGRGRVRQDIREPQSRDR
jgi:hypothetical protein